MGGESIWMTDEKILLPEVIVYAGPNGSGKSTITKMAKTAGVYINADDIKKASLCSDLPGMVGPFLLFLIPINWQCA